MGSFPAVEVATSRRSVVVALAWVALLLPLAAGARAQTPVYLTAWGTRGSGPGQFNLPYQIALDEAGNVCVSDTHNYRIEVFDANGVFLRLCGSMGSELGQFLYPEGIVASPDGCVYVVDAGSYRIQFFTPDGTFVGWWGGQGTDVTAFFEPHGLAADLAGNLYTANGPGVDSHLADGEFRQLWGAIGPNQFWSAWGVAVDGNGQLYGTDQQHQQVKVFDNVGSIERGGATPSGTGPLGIALDPGGNTVYVAAGYVQAYSTTGAKLYALGAAGSGAGTLTGRPAWRSDATA